MSSSLALEPDVYVPSIDLNGNYVDVVPPFVMLTSGLRCVCGTATIFPTAAKFKTHTRSQRHVKWLVGVNANRGNLLTENAAQKKLIIEQRLILARLENDVRSKSVTIDCLSRQIASTQDQNTRVAVNLLDFD
jgi:hypothetical protein